MSYCAQKPPRGSAKGVQNGQTLYRVSLLQKKKTGGGLYFRTFGKEIGNGKIIKKFFSSISIFYLDTFWYNNRYWKPSSGSTLHDSNDGWSIFDDLSLFLHKMWTYFFKNRKLTSTWLRSIQHHRRWKSKPQSIFLTNYHDRLYPKLEKIILCYSY